MIVGAVASDLPARGVSPLLLYKPEQASIPFVTFNWVARVLTQSSLAISQSFTVPFPPLTRCTLTC